MIVLNEGEFFTKNLMGIKVFWDKQPCLFVNSYGGFGGISCLHISQPTYVA